MNTTTVTQMILGACLLWACPGRTFAEDTNTEYLSDRIYSMAICPSFMGVDTTPYRVWPKHVPGSPIRILSKEYKKGLGVDAPSEIIVALNGEYDVFEAEVGAQWQGGSPWPFTFQVAVDGQKRFESTPLFEKDSAQAVRVSVKGARELRLKVTGGGICNWADARLVRSTPAAADRSREPVDMAPFARVLTWDPKRMDGARVNPVEEFPAADVFLENEVVCGPDGIYTVPFLTDGQGCIGLQWRELRRITALSIEFAGSSAPASAGARVERWIGGRDYVTGESPWQGRWEPVKGTLHVRGNQWSIPMSEETRMIRWILPPAAKPAVLRRLSAVTSSTWATAGLLFQIETPAPGSVGEIEVYNGQILDPIGPGAPLRCTWDLGKPLHLKVGYTTQKPWGLDRTVVRVGLPSGDFSVAVDDLLPGEFPPATPAAQGQTTLWKTTDEVVKDLHALGAVYVREHGFFATAEPARIGLAEYKQKIAGRRSVLEQVRRMPDQDFTRALQKTYFPRQDTSPTMLSLACDNRKVIVDRDGTVHFGVPGPFLGVMTFPLAMAPRLGSGKNEGLTRRLDGGWLPIPITTVTDGGLVYSQRTFVAPYGTATSINPLLKYRSLCVAEFTISNPQSAEAQASLGLTFTTNADSTPKPAECRMLAQRLVASKEGKLIAAVDLSGAVSLRSDIKEGVLTLSGSVAPGARVQCVAYMPGWDMKADDHASLAGSTDLARAAEEYWKDVVKPGMQIEIPEPVLQNLILSSVVHCHIVARNEDDGRIVEPWIASNCYGALDGESQVVIRGMTFMGQHEFARMALDYFIKRYTPSGFLVSGYTYGPGTGQHLWVLAEHYGLTKDSRWLSNNAPRIATACRYITRQTTKTRRQDVGGEPPPEHGLLSPGRFADWGHWGFIFAINGHHYAGLSQAATALKEVGLSDASSWIDTARKHREAIVRAYRWMLPRMPVVPLRDGRWVPGYPFELYGFGPVQQFYPSLPVWIYDTLAGAHHLVPLGVLEPNGRETEWMMDHMEDLQFLRSWEGGQPAEYEAQKDSDPFNWGGYLKAQPYYMRNLEIHALRDDVKPFIRAYVNTAVTTMNRENLTVWENTWGAAAWDKTHETGNFLYQSRVMLVMERDNELWLAPFVMAQWMRNGQSVAVTNAPTFFGPVSYRIQSHVGEGHIDVTIYPPSRTTPGSIVLRLRHPEGKKMRRVTVNGTTHTGFDPEREIVRLSATGRPIAVRADY